MKFDYVFIDIDDTLFDFSKAEEISLKNLLETHNIKFTKEFLDEYRSHNLKLWQKIEQGALTTDELPELRFEGLIDESLFDSHVAFIKFSNGYIDGLANCPFIFDDTKPLLDKLFGKCKIYIVTNGLQRVQHPRLDASGLKKYFDGIFISEEMGVQKPEKEFFDYIFEKENIKDREKCIILGDSLTSDMQGGRNAGITTCRIVRNGKPISESDLCDYQIRSLDEFLNIVE